MKLIPVLNKYPLSEVIIHPRTAEQMYGGAVDLGAFEVAYNELKLPVCYNGDINDLAFFQTVQNHFPEIERYMLGRGLLAIPFLCEEIKESFTQSRKDTKAPCPDSDNSAPLRLCEEIKNGGTPSPASVDSEDAVPPKTVPCNPDHIQRIAAFHDDALSSYESVLDGDRPVLGKMKEFWTYQATHLSNGRKMFKKLKKTQHLSTYKAIVSEYLTEAEWMV